MTAQSKFYIKDNSPIILTSGFRVETNQLLEAVDFVNGKLVTLKERTSKMALDIFHVIDFRMLSGFVGEAFVTALSSQIPGFAKNPNIDGYPDILDVSKKSYLDDYNTWKETDFTKFIAYLHGGLEVKNTFGTKRANHTLNYGDSRIGHINDKLDWKAHHRYTNHLLATFSDFVDGCPQIVAVFYSDKLTQDDWAEKQNPAKGSTMTSFSVVKASGWEKLRSGLIICRDEKPYKDFLSA